MAKIKLTDEQKNIFYHIEKTNFNLFIKAYAGCGKTFVITKGCELISQVLQTTFLAFNRHIKEELKDKLPAHVRVNTSHGAGLSALKRKYQDIEFDEFKVDKLIKKKANRWNLQDEFNNSFEKDQYYKELKKVINLCRLTLTLDKKYIGFLAEKHEIKLTDKDIKRVSQLMEFLVNDRTTYDFTDMVFLPAIDNKIWFFPQDYVIVDEFQDLNKAQQKIVEKMLKKDRFTKQTIGRLICVGDAKQLLYGFAGVSERNLEWFENFPNSKTLPLSYTFRCSKNVVKKAQEYVPEINALPDAPEGDVRNGNVLEEAEAGDFVLCRTTEPLVRLFFDFLEQDKTAYIKGSDIGVEIINMINDFTSIGESLTYWENKLNRLASDLKNSGVIDPIEDSGFVALNDKFMVLSFLGKYATDIPDLICKINLLFAENKDGIVLSTVHKAKGLEADRVFIIKPDLLPMKVNKAWQYQQELNTVYVAITRARHELIYDNVWGMEDENEK
jgi:DNA helicase-2/ATP-dependent DNA helicase PcrA